METRLDHRWTALDLLRGLSIIAMLLNLTPGAWEHQYPWLVHAKWEGGNPIDMVAPGFLFCIGAVIPLSFARRLQDGASKGRLAGHILWRTLALVALGLFLNAYPVFDFAHMRIPGVLQKIGLAFGLVSLFVLAIARRGNDGRLHISTVWVGGALAFVLLSHWALIYFVPVPGFGAPRFDPVGCWPAFIDRTLFTVPHMFIYWPVNGKVVFDPDGLLNVWTSGGNILLGVLAGIAYANKSLKRPILTAFVAGLVLMALALVLHGICPIIKNIWTSTFVLFSGGFALVLLAGLTVLVERFGESPVLKPILFPFKVYGANSLLAYLICFLFGPVLDLNWIPNAQFGKVSLRWNNQLMLHMLDPTFASFLFGVIYLIVLFFILWFCYRKRWILKL